jgi:hypothetical protein
MGRRWKSSHWKIRPSRGLALYQLRLCGVQFLFILAILSQTSAFCTAFCNAPRSISRLRSRYISTGRCLSVTGVFVGLGLEDRSIPRLASHPDIDRRPTHHQHNPVVALPDRTAPASSHFPILVDLMPNAVFIQVAPSASTPDTARERLGGGYLGHTLALGPGPIRPPHQCDSFAG